MGIKIALNGIEEELAKELNINEFLQLKKIRPEVVTLELNGNMIEKNTFETTVLNNDDKLEMVFYIGGGDFYE